MSESILPIAMAALTLASILAGLGYVTTYNDPTAYSFDISSLGHKAGDLLFVATYNFYGRITDPFISNPGFSTAASAGVGTGQNKSILAMKVATGFEKEVSSTYDGMIGIAVTAIRGGIYSLTCPRNVPHFDVEFAQLFKGANECERAVSHKPRSLG